MTAELINQIVFYTLAFVAVLGGLTVVLSRNPVYSVLALIATFFAIAGHYFLMQAQFLGVVHIVVYAGAIMVLFLYVIMMLNLNTETEPNKPLMFKIAAFIAGLSLLFVMLASLKGIETLAPQQMPLAANGSIELLGKSLFNNFLLPFEVSAVLFLSAMVGSVLLGKREVE